MFFPSTACSVLLTDVNLTGKSGIMNHDLTDHESCMTHRLCTTPEWPRHFSPYQESSMVISYCSVTAQSPDHSITFHLCIVNSVDHALPEAQTRLLVSTKKLIDKEMQYVGQVLAPFRNISRITCDQIYNSQDSGNSMVLHSSVQTFLPVEWTQTSQQCMDVRIRIVQSQPPTSRENLWTGPAPEIVQESVVGDIQLDAVVQS